MLKRTFVVTYVTTKDCFLHFSEQSSRPTTEGQVMRVSYGDTSNAYMSCGSNLSWIQDGNVGISSIFAKALGIKDKDSITISRCYKTITGLKNITISPTNKPDYEILEMMGEKIQATLLNHVRIIDKDQKMVIWISKSLHVVVNVDDAVPVAPGRLENFTQVIITPPSNLQKSVSSATITPKQTNGFAPSKQELSKSRSVACVTNSTCQNLAPSKKCQSFNPALKEGLNKSVKSLVFRLHSLDTKNYFASQPFNVFVSKHLLTDNFLQGQNLLLNVCLYHLRVISPPVSSAGKEGGDTDIAKNSILTVRLCLLEDYDILREKFAFPVLYANECVLRHFNLKSGAKVVLENLVCPEPSVQNIEMHVNRCDVVSKPLDSFKSYVAQYSKTSKIVLNADVPMKPNDKLCFMLKFTFPAVSYCLMDSDAVRNCNFVVKENDSVNFQTYFSRKDEENAQNVVVPLKEYCMKITNFGEILNTCIGSIKSNCCGGGSKNLDSGNILITGKPGTGKSTLISLLCEKLILPPEHLHVEQINCKNIKGKTMDSLNKMFNQTFMNLIYYQPSILFLDNLDVLCEKVVDAGETLSQESLYFNRISELLAETIVTNVTNNMITIVATSESVMKLNENIFTTRGYHMFRNIHNINDFSKNDRKILMEYLFSRKTISTDDVDFDYLAMKTEGFITQDIVDYVDKCIFEALKQDSTKSHKSVTIKPSHCDEALKNIVALSMREVKLNTTSEKDFSDVGGLDDVKNILVESMQWPAKYPGLFNGAPLRPQSGLLLYGPPGTGKTLVAGAAARMCGMRLIAIKGPELLSKYIGASEQAVRNVFERAQSARPCILFFDEFDSLAPRRGHDSTGVTDRVVNQLLTQLDGVETLNGVCVVAASSRPDLLDPALLRPGRLDRQIMCPLPDQSARLEILKALSKELELDDDVDLAKIAEWSSGFSGADIQAVLFSAQLAAVETLLKSGKEISQDKEPIINQYLLMLALKNTRPSLTIQEKLKYERIYAKFQGGKEDTTNLEQKATLA